MFDLNKESEELETVCPECDSEVSSALSSCPACGSDLPERDGRGVNEGKRAVAEKITSIYNLIFRAEKLETDTRESSQLVSQAKSELKVGDIDKTERLLNDALEAILDPIIAELEDDIRKDSEDFEDLDLVEKIQNLIHELDEAGEVGEEMDDLIEDMEELERSLSEEEEEGLKEEGDDVTSLEEEMEKLEELIEGENEESGKEISEVIDDIEDVIEKGEEKGTELTEVKEELEEIEEGISESDKEESLAKLRHLREKSKASLKFVPIASEIEKKIEEEGHDELKEYAAELEELKEEFERGDREAAIEKGEELKEDIEMIIEIKGVGEEEEEEKEAGKEEEIEDRAKDVLEEAKENLEDLRGSRLDLGELKRSVKKADQAKKEEDYQKTKDLGEKAIEAGDDLEEIIELREEAEEKLEELDEKELVKDEEDYEREIDRYRRATKIGVYGAVNKNLKLLVEELEEGLEKEEEVPGKKEDRDIPEVIKRKIRSLRELQTKVEKSGMEILINKGYLEKAVPKIESKAYEEALGPLSEGEKDFLDKVDPELKDEIESLRERIESTDVEVGEDRVLMLIDEIERMWRNGDHNAALEHLLKTSELVRSLEESGSEKERRTLTASQIVEDAKSFEFDIKKEKRSLKEAREMDEVEDVKENIDNIKANLASKLNDRIKEEVEEVEDRLEDTPREKASIMLDRLTRAETGRRRADIGKMIWYWKKYMELFED